MAKFVTIGERLSTTAPAVNKAFTERDPEPILKRAKQQLDAGATYLDVNIGPAENDGPELMKWAVELLQGNFDNVPLAHKTVLPFLVQLGSIPQIIHVMLRSDYFLHYHYQYHSKNAPCFLIYVRLQDKQV